MYKNWLLLFFFLKNLFECFAGGIVKVHVPLISARFKVILVRVRKEGGINLEFISGRPRPASNFISIIGAQKLVQNS